MGHPDEAIVHEVQPLVFAQANYIDQLEHELGKSQSALNNLQSVIGQMQEKHEKDLEEMGAKFKKIDVAYKEDAVET